MENREKERLLEFIKQESQIKERWQVVEWFEEEKRRFEDEKQNLLEMCEKLEKEYAEKNQVLEEMREQLGTLEQSFREIERKELESKERYKERETQSHQLLSQNMELENQLHTLQKEHKDLSLAVQSLKAEYMVRQNALKVIKDRRDSLLESAAESSVHEAIPLRHVEVMGKGGKVIKATPVKNYYEQSIVSFQSDESRSERELHDEIERLQARIIDLELENANLSIENRELRGEMARSNGDKAPQSLSATPTTKAPIPKKQEPNQTDEPKIKSETSLDLQQEQSFTLQHARVEPEIADKIAHLGQAVETNNFKENEQDEFSEALGVESFKDFKKPLLEDIRIIVPTLANSKDSAQ